VTWRCRLGAIAAFLAVSGRAQAEAISEPPSERAREARDSEPSETSSGERSAADLEGTPPGRLSLEEPEESSAKRDGSGSDSEATVPKEPRSETASEASEPEAAERDSEPAESDAGRESSLRAFFDALTFRDSMDTRRTPQPAFASLSQTSGEPLVGHIDAALMIDLAGLLDLQDRMALGPSVEYHLNTSDAAKRSVLEAGLALEWLPFPLERTYVGLVVAGKAQYKRDWVRGGNGLVASLNLMSIFRGSPGKNIVAVWKPDRLTDLWFADFQYLPWIGAEYEQVLTAEDSGPTGATARGVARVQAVLYPAARFFGHRFELIGDLALRGDLYDELDPSEELHPLVRLSANYYLLKTEDEEAGLGFDYSNGADPEKGLAHSEQWKFGLKLRF